MVAQYLTRLRVADHLDKAPRFAQAERLAMVAEGVGSSDDRSLFGAGFLLRHAHAPVLRLGEDDDGNDTVVHVLRRAGGERIVCRNLALLDRHVHDVV